MSNTMNILKDPLNQYDQSSIQGVKEVGEKLVIEGLVRGMMNNNSYSEKLLSITFCPSVSYIEKVLFTKNQIFFYEAYSEELVPYSSSFKEEANYKLTLYAFLAILSEEEIQEFRSWYL